MIRPLFQGSKLLAQAYDVITWVLTIFILDYMVGPFVLYDVDRCLKVQIQK